MSSYSASTKKTLRSPALPINLNDFVVPEMLKKKTLLDDLYLLHDSNVNNNCTFVYSIAKNLNILKKCKFWQGNGTFDSVPSIFDQLYTFYGRYKNNLLPIVCIVTTHCDKENYMKVLQKLCELEPGLKPSTVHVNFEVFINAFDEIFLECDIQGCYFHWSQCNNVTKMKKNFRLK